MFFNSTTLGRIGWAAAKPLFSPSTRVTMANKAHARCGRMTTYVLTFANCSSTQVPSVVNALVPGSIHLRGRVLPGWRHEVQSILSRGQPCGAELETGDQPRDVFGVVLFAVGSRPVCFHRVMPGWELQHFAARGKCIFVLESLAQMLALFMLRCHLGGPCVSLKDTAAQLA